jgi:hypothetical protein
LVTHGEAKSGSGGLPIRKLLGRYKMKFEETHDKVTKECPDCGGDGCTSASREYSFCGRVPCPRCGGNGEIVTGWKKKPTPAADFIAGLEFKLVGWRSLHEHNGIIIIDGASVVAGDVAVGLIDPVRIIFHRRSLERRFV